MKRIISLLTLVFCISLLFSCSHTYTPDETHSDSTATSVEITTDVTSNMETPTDTSDEDKPMGGTQICLIHGHEWHAFPSVLTEYIGDEAFMEWFDSNKYINTKTECAYPDGSLYEVVREFNIPKEIFEELYYGEGGCYYTYVWNIDLIYSDDEKAADEYYRDKDRLSILASKKCSFGVMKGVLINDNIEKYKDEFKTDRLTTRVSLHEIVILLDLPEEKLRTYDRSSDFEKKNGLVYDYDYSAIYNEDGSIKPLDESLSGIEQDALFCGIDDIYLE